MNLDITTQPDEEEVIIIVENNWVLKANKGTTNKEPILNKRFRELADQDPVLYSFLYKIAIHALSFED